MALQPDGKVLIGGDFTLVKGASRNGLARLNADGTLDQTFNPGPGISSGTGAIPYVEGILVQPDGRILIAGWFATFNGTVRNGIARLNADGSLDGSFNPGSGADGVVRAIALQADGKMLIGGDFTTFNGVPRPGVARLYGDAVALSLTIAQSGNAVIVSWPSSATGFELQQSTDLNMPNWTAPAEVMTDNGTTKSISVKPAPGQRYFRLYKP
jgi:uncharacterized delta-60 repeat protein